MLLKQENINVSIISCSTHGFRVTVYSGLPGQTQSEVSLGPPSGRGVLSVGRADYQPGRHHGESTVMTVTAYRKLVACKATCEMLNFAERQQNVNTDVM